MRVSWSIIATTSVSFNISGCANAVTKINVIVGGVRRLPQMRWQAAQPANASSVWTVRAPHAFPPPDGPVKIDEIHFVIDLTPP